MKTCTMCKKEKPLTEFNKNRSKKDGLNNICRDCSKERSKQYYRDNHDKHVAATGERNRKRRKEYGSLIAEIKSAGCSLCSEMEPCTLDFHHLNPEDKLYEPSFIIKSGYSKKIIKEELAKCILVCANCHRKIHAGLIEVEECAGIVFNG